MKASPEAMMIIQKIKGKGKPAPKDEASDDETEGDAGSEATRAACEDMLKVVLKREPKPEETDAWVEAMDSYFTAKGY